MKTIQVVALVFLAGLMPASAQKGTLRFGEPSNTKEPPPSPPRVWENPNYYNPFVSNTPPLDGNNRYVYDQKPVSVPSVLVTEEQAQTIIGRFKEAYPKLGSPRFLIYVNRELVDEQSGMKLIKRQERIDGSRSSGTNGASTIRSSVDNTYRADGRPQPSLADKQTVRDVERLFGRPLRAGGAGLADQRVASQLIADRPIDELIGTTDSAQARKDREALGKVADAVIEVLISSKNIVVPRISGDQTITIPDIQATAIRLSDSKILGQASSSDVTTRVPPATLANFDVREISEATALALMEDISMNP